MNGTFNGMPLWVKIITTVGFPIFMALVLMWVLFGIIVPTIAEDVQTNQRIGTENNSLLKEHAQDAQRQIELFKLICRNTAKTEFAISNCDKI